MPVADTTSVAWYENKAMHKWYLPSLVRFLTKIPLADWDSTPGDTNLNESAHPYTNRQTGIGLPLLEAIEKCVVITFNLLLFTFLVAVQSA